MLKVLYGSLRTLSVSVTRSDGSSVLGGDAEEEGVRGRSYSLLGQSLVWWETPRVVESTQ